MKQIFWKKYSYALAVSLFHEIKIIFCLPNLETNMLRVFKHAFIGNKVVKVRELL